jgi:PAS domain-containing protein
VLDRAAGPLWVAFVYGVILFVETYAIFVGWQTTRRDRLAGRVIMATGVIAMTATILPLLADVARIPLPHFGTLQVALWVPVFSVLLSREYALRDERLAASQQRYRTLIESAPDAIVVLDLGAGGFVDRAAVISSSRVRREVEQPFQSPSHSSARPRPWCNRHPPKSSREEGKPCSSWKMKRPFGTCWPRVCATMGSL